MPRVIDILLVEDNPADVELTREGFVEASVPHRIHLVPEGAEALAFLRREGRHAGAPRPDLVLLDLNLPGVGGAEVLAEVKHDPDLRAIPVVILSSSGAARDVRRAYELHANSYVRKPGDFARFVSAIRALEAFWLRTACLPSP